MKLKKATQKISCIILSVMMLFSSLALFTYAEEEMHITRQPTCAEPSVEVSREENVTYQWYESLNGTYDITGENATGVSNEDVLTPDGITGSSFYTHGTGWQTFSFKAGQVYAHYMFEMELHAGDTVTLKLKEGSIGLLQIGNADGTGKRDATVTATENGASVLMHESGLSVIEILSADEKIVAEATITTVGLGKRLEGETQKTLINRELGKEYACKVIWNVDGEITEKISQSFRYSYLISQEPTVSAPNVKVNSDSSITKYQWYSLALGKTTTVANTKGGEEYTQAENIISGTYETGLWNSEVDNVIELSVPMTKGDIIKITPQGEASCHIMANGSVLSILDGEAVYISVRDTELAHISISSEKAYSVKIEHTEAEAVALEGVCDSSLVTDEAGAYFCAITIDDGKNTYVLTSHYVLINQLVSFETNGADPIPSVSVAIIDTAPEISRQGYLFVGWFLDKELSDKASFPLNIEGTVVLYAKWFECDHLGNKTGPTCTEDGECEYCKAHLEATGHKFSTQYHMSSEFHFYQCSCGERIEKSPHIYSAWQRTEEPSRLGYGTDTRICTECGSKDTRSIPPTGGIGEGEILIYTVLGIFAVGGIIVSAMVLYFKKRSLK